MRIDRYCGFLTDQTAAAAAADYDEEVDDDEKFYNDHGKRNVEDVNENEMM